MSHRALLFAGLAAGRSELRNLQPGQDVAATIACLRQLGVSIVEDEGVGCWTVVGAGGPSGFSERADLDTRNSGTTTRLLMGVLAGAGAGPYRLSGDASLNRRPMERVVRPLELMGATIDTSDGRLPAAVRGRPLHGIDYTLPVPSAQVKSAILLAGLFATGITTVTEPEPTRNHTELGLAAFGGMVIHRPGQASVTGGQQLHGAACDIPGDPSSAAFWAAAAAALRGSAITIEDVSLNPTRIGFLDVLRRFGAVVEIEANPAVDQAAEPRGRIVVSHGAVGDVVIAPQEVPGLIDELPVLAALATHGGTLTVTGAAELRVKESDRITALAAGLRAMGGTVEEAPDGFRVDGRAPLCGGRPDAAGDHRLAMAFAIAALGATGETVIDGADSVSVSYPAFFDVLAQVRA